ncbi:serine/threonine protein kinase [Ktedonosporobacter rubrisoli]|uniref:Serine/threonine protein kinase n=1 Tax=Ktedonosporobacter rubrisoli TaxID=2509675 RepID=A0A4P6JTS1_KTERU|nr:protein kinase [Ktedonosporobacter rubrisoli]QBD78854.1 serine/threonine protein kinase [Ktedonosporobacter rubrisoli]
MLEGSQIDRYRLLQSIGHGSAGEVYLAEDSRIAQRVAIKLIRIETENKALSGTEKRHFQREAKAIARLDHPNILPLYDYGEENIEGIKFAYLVMPFRQEGTLADWFEQYVNSKQPPIDDVLHFIEQAASALQHAHDRQVLHQDIKPSNFLLRSRSDRPDQPDLQLTDFGIARFYITSAQTSQSIRGTPAYMAPEQWNGHPTPASDQYALAIMAYQLLTGQLPFRGSLEQLMLQHLEQQPKGPSLCNPALHREVDIVLSLALAKKPEERFASVSAFARAFYLAVTQSASVELSPLSPLSPVTPLTEEAPQANVDSCAENIQATLTITPAEARSGVTRTLTLALGHKIQVVVPPGASNGQILRLPYPQRSSPSGTPMSTNSLILTILVQEAPRKAALSGIVEHLHTPFRALQAYSNKTFVPRSLPGKLSRGKAIVLGGLIALIILAGSGLLLINNAANQRNANTARIAAMASARANLNPYPPGGGTLIINDPLQDNSKNYGWEELTHPARDCHFSNHAYLVQELQPKALAACTAQNMNFSNFVLQVQMTFLTEGFGGILFRADIASSRLYYFQVISDGEYFLYLYRDGQMAHSSQLTPDHATIPASIFHQGIKHPNLLAVVARGPAIDLYVNHHHLTTITDNTLSHGQISFIASGFFSPIKVAYSDIKVWKL